MKNVYARLYGSDNNNSYCSIRGVVERLFLCVYFVVLLDCFRGGYTLPVPQDHDDSLDISSREERSVLPNEHQINFMKKFGYLDSSGPEALITEDALVEAIKEIQLYGAINQTGVLDNDTVQLMQSKRCGIPDIIENEPDSEHKHRYKRFVVGSGGWNKRLLTYYISNWSPKLTENEVSSQLQRAFDAWARHGKLKFRRVYDKRADIVISFGSRYHGDSFPFDGPGSVLAHAFFPGQSGSLSGDMHFDDEEFWTVNSQNSGVDFYSVAVHELGHSLGLAHSPDPTSIMNPYYKGKQELGYDDIMGMYELYVSKKLEEEDVPHNDVPNPRRPRPDIPERPNWDVPAHPYTPPTTERPRFRPYDGDQGRDRFHRHRFTHRYRPDTTPVFEETSTSRFWRYSSNDDRRVHIYPSTTSSSSEKVTDVSITYVGDDVDVKDHIRRYSRYGTTTTSTEKVLVPSDNCLQNVEAAALLRGELFFFKGQNMWRLKDINNVMPGYPVDFLRFFHKLPVGVKHIDAIYERPTDSNIIMFTGQRYLIFDGNRVIDDALRPITEYGLPSNAEKVNAIFCSNYITYLFSKEHVWRFNETSKRIIDENRISSLFHDIPNNLDAALTWKNGEIYVFKDNKYWKLHENNLTVEDGYPQMIDNYWLKCH